MKVLVVDDHALVREGLRHVLQDLDGEPVRIVEAASAADALAQARGHPDLDLVLLDLRLPDASGLDTLLELGRVVPDLPVVLLSGEESADVMHTAFDRGAAGFIPKSSLSDVLLSALRLVMAGGIYVPPAMLGRPPEARAAPARPAFDPVAAARLDITERQAEVLRLVLQGLSNKEICRVLDLAEPTVKVHVSALLRALDVKSRTQLVLAAAGRGIIPVEAIRTIPGEA
ncbi:MAG: response regulator transcription factor [Rhodocyclaceae bacterium]|nr:response regulator transcription factor [Rhodocyclaceae bacterium]